MQFSFLRTFLGKHHAFFATRGGAAVTPATRGPGAGGPAGRLLPLPETIHPPHPMAGGIGGAWPGTLAFYGMNTPRYPKYWLSGTLKKYGSVSQVAVETYS